MKRDRRSLLLLPLFLVLLISHLALPHRAAAEGLMESRSGISKRENTGACPQTQSPCGHVPVDVVYVIDSSNSVHHPDFERAKNIIVQLIEFFYLVRIWVEGVIIFLENSSTQEAPKHFMIGVDSHSNWLSFKYF